MVKGSDGGVAKGVEGSGRPLDGGRLGGPGWLSVPSVLCWFHNFWIREVRVYQTESAVRFRVSSQPSEFRDSSLVINIGTRGW